MNQPLISVIMPVFNGQLFIAEAIKSIYAQNYSNLEILVIDDGSTDNSAKIAEQLGAIVFKQAQNTGIATARNRGLAEARGELITFLDADDLWTKHKLKIQLRALEQYPYLHGIGGYAEQFFMDSSYDTIKHTHFLPILSAALFWRDTFIKVGLFDETLMQAEDLDWYMRFQEQALQFALLPETMILYRIHNTNTTTNKTVTQQWTLRAIQKRFKRYAGRPIPIADFPILEPL
jgi:glycosyltransferase involved in cell wall biosynthesis